MDCDSRNYGGGLRSTCIRMSASSVVSLSSLFHCVTLTKYFISPSHYPPSTRLLSRDIRHFIPHSHYLHQQNCLQLFRPFFSPASTRGMKPHGFERAPVNVTQKSCRGQRFPERPTVFRTDGVDPHYCLHRCNAEGDSSFFASRSSSSPPPGLGSTCTDLAHEWGQ
jgi:hypothetical protein